jgi:hypothetical protein
VRVETLMAVNMKITIFRDKSSSSIQITREDALQGHGVSDDSD